MEGGSREAWVEADGQERDPFFSQVLILKGFKSFVVEVFILKGLRADFAEVRILKGLTRRSEHELKVES